MSIGYENILIGVEGEENKYIKTVTGGTFELGERAEAQVFSNPSAYEVIQSLQPENPDTKFLVFNADVV